jgi:hypothetical protein
MEKITAATTITEGPGVALKRDQDAIEDLLEQAVQSLKWSITSDNHAKGASSCLIEAVRILNKRTP